LHCSTNALIEELVGLTGNTTHKHGYRVENTHPIGGTYKGEGRPYVWDQESRDPREMALIAEALGVTPGQEIGLAAMCSADVDNQILGEMALWMADKASGLVDLAGCVELPQVALPGRIVRIPYETAAGGEAEYMVMDRVAFRAWVSCPMFRMVK
jgi:hypothetical protein